MRLLIACSNCDRRYDASSRAPGSRFRCHCGQVVVVERVDGHEAAVVRCSSCGGPRQPGAVNCTFCGAEFEAGERLRNTICPQCMTRISDKAKFCHSCGTGLNSESVGVTASDLDCPVCGTGTKLAARTVAGDGPPVLECGTCAGLWLEHDKVEQLAQVAQTKAAAKVEAKSPPAPLKLRQQNGPMYRDCPACGKMMNRRNYGRVSGIVVDVCRAHGIWFDADELPGILAWIEAGGLHKKAVIENDEQRRAKRAARDRAEAQAKMVGGTASGGNLGGGGYRGLGGLGGPRRGDYWDSDDLGDVVVEGLGAAMRVLGRLFSK
ncbi:MAG: zinc ribbon domain-containing protein [Planctomycetota bacterium]|jgi:Zn-finger nucleic acid-binding protein|nr:zinc ribbon domain-containing protein [Planctomycetota bacterium]